MTKTALIDADILCYRIGWAAEEDSETRVATSVRGTVTDILLGLEDVEDFECFLSGPSDENFRHNYAVTRVYKGNRKGMAKPKHYNFIRQHFKEEYDADMSVEEEADDTITKRAYELGLDNVVVCSLDKDFLQIPTTHYNFANKQRFTMTSEQALLHFYMQFLTGDVADNIEGVKGIGVVTAKKYLDGKEEDEMWKTIIGLMGYDRALENGRLLYLRRKDNEIWEPPKNA